jgi:hypothetical protein
MRRSEVFFLKVATFLMRSHLELIVVSLISFFRIDSVVAEEDQLSRSVRSPTQRRKSKNKQHQKDGGGDDDGGGGGDSEEKIDDDISELEGNSDTR